MANYYHKLLLKWGYSPLRTSSISSLIVRQHDHHTNHRQNIAKKLKSHEEKTNIFSLSKRKGVHYEWWRHCHQKKRKKEEKKRGVLLRISCLRFGITCFELGLSILGLGDHILNRESILRVLGLGRWLDLLTLALILGLRTPLDSLLTLGRLNPLVLVIGLASPC